ncbi:translation elongation factor Ts [Caldisericum exile]|uniref:Elongation factor Ts n=1 Tax=Caldisericum exile (strain DSM 21853 / NBRC 104410 / AZM16c01) TaxID=511051 RepID=A0A7U6JGV6_CALEA|nr:translation elongation factor Ts [Caldisericum exile]BAL80932.1 elongation factor Ts [Caldisericum exile AZM16c01]
MGLDLIKELRSRTGAGIADCKKALEEANGDIEKAIDILREKGIAKAVKKAGRVTNEGVVASYIHPGNQLGVLVEVNCETDFVARTDEFKKLADEIALQIAASSPDYVSREEVPEDVIEKEKEIYRKQLEEEGKPANVIDRIIEGKIETFYKEHCLLEQPYLRDESITIEQLIKEHISKFGENITVRRFVRFKVGE